jgi:fluoride exporter
VPILPDSGRRESPGRAGELAEEPKDIARIGRRVRGERTRAPGPATPAGRLTVPRFDRREIAAIAVGGAIGALLRVWLARELAPAAGHWPWVTLAVNVSGSIALGYFATRLAERLPLSTYRRPLLGTGFCGAFTTFSTMQIEILRMLEADRYWLAIGYAGTSIALGFVAVWVTTAAVRRTRVIA